MHAPPYYTGHLAFTGVATVWLVVAAVATGIAGVIHERRPGSEAER